MGLNGWIIQALCSGPPKKGTAVVQRKVWRCMIFYKRYGTLKNLGVALNIPIISHPFFHFFQFNLRFLAELHLFQRPLDLWLSTLGLGSSLLNPNVQALNIAVLIGIGLLAVLRNQSGCSGNAEIRRVHEWWCWSSCWYCLAGGGLAPIGSSDSVAVQDFTNPAVVLHHIWRSSPTIWQ